MSFVSLFALILKLASTPPGRGVRTCSCSLHPFRHPVIVRLTHKSAKGWRRSIAQFLVRIEHARHQLSAAASRSTADQSHWAAYAGKRVAELLGWPVRIACQRGLLRIFSYADLEALVTVGDEGAVRFDVLCELVGEPRWKTERLIQECTELGLVREERFLAKDPCSWIWLTPLGCRAIARPPISPPHLGLLERRFALAKVRADLIRGLPGQRCKWTAGWKLRRRRGPENRAVDAVLEVDNYEHAIVVLLHPKKRHELERTLIELCGVYPRVICPCSRPARSQVERVSQELCLNNLVVLDAPSLTLEPRL